MTVCFPTVAIVGSGPSGCYVAQFLQKKWTGAQITIFESLPVPYGLIRYGVAADHQGSKAVIQQFERMFEKGGVEFRGNVSIGRDISYAKLTESFDIVVLATGLNNDAALDIPVHPQAPVVGAGSLLKALNGHPRASLPKVVDGTIRKLGRNVAVIGSGNVAIDVLRMVAKSDVELVGSDIADEIRNALGTEEVNCLTLISRSSASDAKCDESMMAELLSLPGIVIRAQGISEYDQGPVAQLLKLASGKEVGRGSSRLTINFIFNAVPVEVDEAGGLANVSLVDRLAGTRADMMFDTVVTAIGFNNGCARLSNAPSEDLAGDGVYRVGWLRRGPKGTVAENRKDAKAISDQIVSDYEAGIVQARKLGLISIVHELPISVVNHQGWLRIDRHERAYAKPTRCREKVTEIRAMLKIVQSGDDIKVIAASEKLVD